MGDCVEHWSRWYDELAAAVITAGNLTPAIGTGHAKDLNPAPRKGGKLGDAKPNTTNWQNLYKALPEKFRSPKVFKWMKLAGRVNIAILLADGLLIAGVEAHCAGHCGGWISGKRYDPGFDDWF